MAPANWIVDGYAGLVAELSAALTISRGRARGLVEVAIGLRERLPRVAGAAGDGMAGIWGTVSVADGVALDARLDELAAAGALSLTYRRLRIGAPQPASSRVAAE